MHNFRIHMVSDHEVSRPYFPRFSDEETEAQQASSFCSEPNNKYAGKAKNQHRFSSLFWQYNSEPYFLLREQEMRSKQRRWQKALYPNFLTAAKH